MGCAGVPQQPVVQRIVRSQVAGHRVHPLQQDFPVGRMLPNLNAGANGLSHPLQVKGFLVVVVVQIGVIQRVAGLQAQLALAQGQLQAGADADVVLIVVDDYLRRPVFGSHQQGRDLHIVAEIRIRHGVAQPHLYGRRLDVGAFSGGAEQHARGGMVAQVLPHARQVVRHRNPHFPQMLRRPHAGEQQQLRRSHGAAADDNLAPLNDEPLAAAGHLHAHRALAVKHHPARWHIRPQGKVEAVPRQVQIRQRRADANPVQGVAGAGRHAGGLGVVLVRVVVETQGQTGGLESGGMGQPLVGTVAPHRDRAFGAVPVVLEIVVIFHTAEKGQHAGIAPFPVAPLRPAVIVLRDAPVQHLPIDGRRPARSLAARDDQVGLLRRHARGRPSCGGRRRRKIHCCPASGRRADG